MLTRTSIKTFMTFIALLACVVSAQARTYDNYLRDVDAQLGVGVSYVPWWMGSDSYRVVPLPIIDLTYKRMFFLSSGRGIGAQFKLGDNFVTGLRATYTWGRPDHGYLKNMKNLAGSIDGGIFARYMMLPWIFTGDVLTALSNQGHKGTFGTVGVAYKYEGIPHWEILPRVGLTYGSDRYMDSYFGIEQGEAAASGFSQYKPHAGIRDLGFGANIVYLGFESWRIYTNLGGNVLFKEAADSDVVQNSLQFRGFVGVGYVL